MRKDIVREAEGLLTGHRHQRTWKKVVGVLACAVVFCTTYALILPAITLENTTYCGFDTHQHGPECYEKVLICGQKENETAVHGHNSECYARQRELICGLEEASSVHTHTESCIASEQRLICENKEPEHQHAEECYETVVTYTCGLEEGDPTDHVHTDECYTTEEIPECGPVEGEEIPGHAHTEECYESVLTCEKEKHTHELSCYSNPEADVESPEDWSRSVTGVELTGNWSSDLIAVAESQLGYTESSQNYVVDENGMKKGYTRYGAWYGDPYGDWCAMFVSFCLDYAGVENFPMESSCIRWVEALKKAEYNFYRESGDYTPKTGDLIFFDWDGDQLADHVGLVAERIEDGQGVLTEIKTIEGNAADQVKYITYSIADEHILAYGALPENPDFAEQDETVLDDGEFPKTLTCTGEDYAVSVTYGADAALPEGVELHAQEYSRDSEPYHSRFEEAAGIYGWTETDMSAFRLFNIGLYVGEEEVEPAAEINVTITYMDSDAADKYCQVIHFAEQPEPVAASVFDDGTQTVNFSTDGFSDYGIMLAEPRAANHPLGVHTETWNVFGVNLFSIGTAGHVAAPLSGVTYTVYQNGNEVGRFTTESNYSLSLGDLSPGTYTVKQTGVPYGYVVVEQEKTFTVNSGSSWTTAGVFYVYTAEDYSPNKTAQVYDYKNRIYEEILTAPSGGYDAQITPGNFDFVVDSSNSMLFPSRLVDTGAMVSLSLTNDNNWSTSDDASGNSNRMNEALRNKGLSDSGLYYIIALENTKATVYALWKSTDNQWYCQDAASYAQAEQSGDYTKYSDYGTGWPNAGGCLNGGDRRIENRGYKLFGDLGTDIDAQTGDKKTYKIYTAEDKYDRLTYLKYDLALIIHELAALNPQNTVTLTAFDADVKKCITRTLDDAGVQALIDSVSTIQTSGGTAQERGLMHVVGTYAGNKSANPGITCNGGSHLKANQKNYVVLITDGALNSSDTQAETKLKNAATTIRNSGAKLMTVGLSLQNVTAARTLLNDVNGGGIASAGWAFLDEDAEAIATTVQNKIWEDLFTLEGKEGKATITDYISDSFYLVTPDGNALAEGDWITLNGTKATDQGQRAGQVCRDANGWYIKWTSQMLPADRNNQWTGKLYVKAKEDFIGGNSIDTNKSASVTKLDSDGNAAGTIQLETPTVNVRLLPMTSHSSEETVFLGDEVSPEIRLKALLEQIRFTKIRTDSGDAVYNRAPAKDTEGLEDSSFTLAYAMKQLTEKQWNALLAGQSVKVDYTYDSASSHGAVGYFTLQLAKNGSGGDYKGHSTVNTGKEVEAYTLTVNYTAYKLGETDRPIVNVHNGSEGPGTEVGTGTALENGAGTVSSDNVHKIHVVDGKITVIKEIEESLKSTEDQTFTFTLLRLGSDGAYVEVKDEHGSAVTLNVTVGSNQTRGTATLDTLPRGTYKLVEASSEVHNVKEMTVEADGTNCVSAGSGSREVTFTIGTDADGTNVIQTGAAPVYTTLRGSTPATSEACKGVSYGTVKIVNEKTVYTAKLPVVKHWNQVPENEYSGLTIYVALYRNGMPVKNEDGHVLALALNKDNGWHDSFTVALDEKEQNVAEMGFSIRELSGVTDTGSGTNSAVVMNVEEGQAPTIIYYKSAVDSGLVIVGDKGYLVSYGETTSGDYILSATNSKAHRLPQSGGRGTTPYTIGGLLTICAGFLLLYSNKKRRKEDFASS